MSDHLTPEVSDRGFMRLPLIPDSYGNGGIEVYESSNADGPHLWVKITDSGVEAFAHLPLENVAQLRDQLDHLIENHYQVKER